MLEVLEVASVVVTLIKIAAVRVVTAFGQAVLTLVRKEYRHG